MLFQTAFGLHISDRIIEIMELSSRSKIGVFNRVEIEPDVVKGGLILNKQKLVEKLKEVITKANLKSNRAILFLPEEKIFTRILQINENLGKKKLKQNILAEAMKTLSLEQKSIYWDHQIIMSGSGKRQILYAAVFKDIIDDYLDILSQVKIKPVAFEMESLSLSRALLEKERNAIIINLGNRTTNISIFSRKKIKWSSVKLIGGNNFIQAVAEKMKISSDEAEKMISQGWKQKQVGEILEKELEEWIMELKEIIDSLSETVEKIILTGEACSISGLDAYLSGVLRNKVVTITSLKKEGVSENFSPAVFGLAVRGLNKKVWEKEINFLPKKFENKSPRSGRPENFFRIFRYAFLVLFLLFFGGIIANYRAKNTAFFPEISEEKNSPDNLNNKEELIPVVSLKTEQIAEGIEQTEEKETEEEKQNNEEKTGQETTKQNEVQESEWIFSRISVKEDVTVLNVRSGPGTDYAIIAKIHAGEDYPFIQEDKEWYKISIDGRIEGWVSKDYILKK